MKTPVLAAWILVPLVSMAASGVAAGGQPSEPSSAQKFVENFYTWYIQSENKFSDLSMDEFALRKKPQWFSAAIAQGLREDEAAAAKSPGEVVGLDFDPFLNAQDVCEPYKTGKVTRVDKAYRVEVFGSCPEPGSKNPDVIAAVEKKNGAWVFVDFYYPGQGDLFSVLQALKEEREKPGK